MVGYQKSTIAAGNFLERGERQIGTPKTSWLSNIMPWTGQWTGRTASENQRLIQA